MKIVDVKFIMANEKPIYLEPLVFKKLPNRIGFYEWLGNPIYGVLEIFQTSINDIWKIRRFQSDGKYKLPKPPEILDYLEKQIKPKE